MKETIVKRCACGCGEIVQSSRPNAKYANGSKCRNAAMRKRSKEEEKLEALGGKFQRDFISLNNRYGAKSNELRGLIMEFAKQYEVNASEALMAIVWKAAVLEYEFCEGGKHEEIQQ